MARVLAQGDTRPMAQSRRGDGRSAPHPRRPGRVLRQGRRDLRHRGPHRGRGFAGLLALSASARRALQPARSTAGCSELQLPFDIRVFMHYSACFRGSRADRASLETTHGQHRLAAPVDYRTAPRRTTATGRCRSKGALATADARRSPRTPGCARATSSSSTATTSASTSSSPTRSSRIRFEHPRGPRRDRDERPDRVFCSGANIFMLGKSQPCLEGELLQVHQRDAQRPRGRQPRALRPEVPRRGQRRLRRRRLRAGRGVRRDHPRRRPLVVGQPARGAPARRAARHRRPDAGHRQAPRAPRPCRHLLHHREGIRGQKREGLEAGRRGREDAGLRRSACRSAPASWPR